MRLAHAWKLYSEGFDPDTPAEVEGHRRVAFYVGAMAAIHSPESLLSGELAQEVEEFMRSIGMEFEITRVHEAGHG